MANVVPLFRKDGRDEPENYRPVSLIPEAEKLLDKILKEKIIIHLERASSWETVVFVISCVSTSGSGFSVQPLFKYGALVFARQHFYRMAAMRQYFWLWLGLSIIILNAFVILIFYLICRRLGSYQSEMRIKKFFSPSSQTYISQVDTSRRRTEDNAYQLNNTEESAQLNNTDNTVNKSSSMDNISHSYEDPVDFEKISNHGYIDVHPDEDESYDDVIAPGWVDEDYDDVA
ncbi:uncharacterized protein LOC132211011 [Stegostoma tigrinum]|uniref:uncharacterized protein LOC132211011 n=1 Tax=Stegostoma tigrinum TaxID=3053191 RepID=UPI0028703A47|nr:uncharacterized protein LOC132211011 [Stegostoma tigrinum]